MIQGNRQTQASYEEDLGVEGFEFEEDYNAGWGDSLDEGPSEESLQESADLTRREWRQLATKVRNDHPENQDELLHIINQALIADRDGDIDMEVEQFDLLSSELGLDPVDYLHGAKLESGVGGDSEEAGDAPTRLGKDGTRYYEARDSDEGFSLVASGKKSKNVVRGAGSVTLEPANPEDTAKVREEGGKIHVEFSSGDSYEIDKSTQIHIACDHVSGDIESGHVSIGRSNPTPLLSESRLQEISSKIGASLDQIGSVSYGLGNDGLAVNALQKYTVGFCAGDSLNVLNISINLPFISSEQKASMIAQSTSTMAAEAQAEAKDVKEVLGQIQKAIDEKDPEARASLWSSISDALGRWQSQDSAGGGNANNRAQLLFNVLYGELGEENFKWALQKGVIPSDIAGNLSGCLTAFSTEGKEMTNEITNYQRGGPGWTHQSSADFLDKYSRSEDSEA